MKEIFCSFVGTALALFIAGCVAERWVNQKMQRVERAVHQTISDVADAPANALNGLMDAMNIF